MSWRTLSERTVYENAWMRVQEDSVINPGGGRNEYGHVRFKNTAVAILPLDQDQHTWLVGQQRYTLGAYSWELPMGGAPKHEHPLDCAQRELAEETGLTAQHWAQALCLHTSNSITDEYGVIFHATGLREGTASPEETEVLAVQRLPVAQAIEMACNGEITDAISIAALLHFSARGCAVPEG